MRSQCSHPGAALLKALGLENWNSSVTLHAPLAKAGNLHLKAIKFSSASLRCDWRTANICDASYEVARRSDSRRDSKGWKKIWISKGKEIWEQLAKEWEQKGILEWNSMNLSNSVILHLTFSRMLRCCFAAPIALSTLSLMLSFQSQVQWWFCIHTHCSKMSIPEW